MSERDSSNNESLLPAGQRGLVAVGATNPLVARGMADLARDFAKSVCEVESAEPKRMRVEFPNPDAEDDCFTISVRLTQVGDRLFRLDEIPMFLFPIIEWGSYLDVIEVGPPADDGEFRFVRVAQRSDWKTLGPYQIPAQTWLRLIYEDEQLPWLQDLVARGGNWFGSCGQVFLCLPPGLDFDPTRWITGEQ